MRALTRQAQSSRSEGPCGLASRRGYPFELVSTQQGLHHLIRQILVVLSCIAHFSFGD